MSSLSQFFSGGAGSQIGDLQLLSTTRNKVTKPNGEEWLRTGVVAPAGSYTGAALVQHLRVYGNQSAAFSHAGTGECKGATNGAGTWVIVNGSSTCKVSTDDGATWTEVTSNNANTPDDVCWTGSRFITVGNSATQLTFSWSTTGTSFTAGGSAAVTSATAKQARIAWNGSIALAVCSSTNVAQAASTTDGTSVTARTLSQNVPGNLIEIGVAGTTFVIGGTSTAWVTSTNGTSFSNLVGPIGLGTERNFSRGGPLLLVFNQGSVWNGTYYTTPDGITFTARSIPGFVRANFSALTPGSQPFWTGSRYVCLMISSGEISTDLGGEFMYSPDGISWDIDQMIAGIQRQAGTTGFIGGYSNKLIAFQPTSGHAAYALDYPNTPDWVGVPYYVPINPISSATGFEARTFVRIK